VKSVPWFRKDIKFKVVEPAEKPKEEVKQSSEPEIKPKEVEKETLDVAELETLKAQWCKSLMELVALGSPNAMKIQQDRADRYFYELSRLDEKALEAGVSSRAFRCLRDDLNVYDVKQTFRCLPQGVIVNTEFQKVDPEKVGLDAAKIMQLVDRIIKGNVP
jgi:hypothetical protein